MSFCPREHLLAALAALGVNLPASLQTLAPEAPALEVGAPNLTLCVFVSLITSLFTRKLPAEEEGALMLGLSVWFDLKTESEQ